MRKLKNVVAVIRTSAVYTEHVYHCPVHRPDTHKLFRQEGGINVKKDEN